MDYDDVIERARELGAQMAVLEEMRELIRAGRCDDGTAVQIALKALNAERAMGYRMGIEAAAAKVQAEWPHDKRALIPIIRALSDNAEAIARGDV